MDVPPTASLGSGERVVLEDAFTQARKELNADFTLDELLSAKTRMRRRKAEGTDGVAYEFVMGRPGASEQDKYSHSTSIATRR